VSTISLGKETDRAGTRSLKVSIIFHQISGETIICCWTVVGL